MREVGRSIPPAGWILTYQVQIHLQMEGGLGGSRPRPRPLNCKREISKHNILRIDLASLHSSKTTPLFCHKLQSMCELHSSQFFDGTSSSFFAITTTVALFLWHSGFHLEANGISFITFTPSLSFSCKICLLEPLFWTTSSLVQAEMLGLLGANFPHIPNPTISWGKGMHSTLFQFIASIVYNLEKSNNAFKPCNKK